MMDRNYLIAKKTCWFVKMVCPYGSDNRESFPGGEQYRKKGNNKIAYELLNKIPRRRELNYFHDYIRSAADAISKGVGDCREQTSIAIIFLLSQNVMDITSHSTQFTNPKLPGIRKTDGHIYAEFNHDMILDPWDNCTFYSKSKHPKDDSNSIRRSGKIISFQFSHQFNFNDNNAIEFSDFIENSSQYDLKTCALLFLKKMIDQSSALSLSEKQILHEMAFDLPPSINLNNKILDLATTHTIEGLYQLTQEFKKTSFYPTNKIQRFFQNSIDHKFYYDSLDKIKKHGKELAILQIEIDKSMTKQESDLYSHIFNEQRGRIDSIGRTQYKKFFDALLQTNNLNFLCSNNGLN